MSDPFGDLFAGRFRSPSGQASVPQGRDLLSSLDAFSSSPPAASPSLSEHARANETLPTPTPLPSASPPSTSASQEDDPFGIFQRPTSVPSSSLPVTTGEQEKSPFDVFSSFSSTDSPVPAVTPPAEPVRGAPAVSSFASAGPQGAAGEEEQDGLDGMEPDQLFERTFTLSHALESKLQAMGDHILTQVSPELHALVDTLKLLEIQVSERDADARRLLQAFKDARDKEPAPVPPSDDGIAPASRAAPPPFKSAREYTSQEIQAITALQRLWRKRRGSLTTGKLTDVVLYYRSHPDEEARRHRTWHRAVRQLLHSEKRYVHNLGIWQQHFAAPLERKLNAAREQMASGGTVGPVECKEVTKDQYQRVFMNVKVLLSYHEGLEKQLRQAYYYWPRRPLQLAEALEKLLPCLKAYATYMQAYPRHLETLMELKRTNRSFMSWLQSTQRSHFPAAAQGTSYTDMNVSDLSIMPIQRVSAYVLLLERLVQSGAESDSDRPRLQKLLGELQRFSQLGKEAQLRAENLRMVFKVQWTITGADSIRLLRPHRVFLRDGPILTLTDRIHRRHLFLFNDAMLLTKKAWRPGSQEKVYDLFLPLHGALLTDDVEVPFSFRLRYDQGQKFMCFVAASDEEKATWMRDITNATAHTVKHLDPSDVDEMRRKLAQPDRSISIQGYLSKMEGGFLKMWKTRWIQIATGILYSFASEDDSVPLRTYHLHEYVVKQLYVTDQFSRYCVHMIQWRGTRQIILSTHSQTILREWLAVIRQYVDLEHSTAFTQLGGTDAPGVSVEKSAGPSITMEDAPVIVTSEEESTKSFAPSTNRTQGRFFSEAVDEEFMDAVKEKKAGAYRLFFDEQGNIQVEMPKGSSSDSQAPEQSPVVKPLPPAVSSSMGGSAPPVVGTEDILPASTGAQDWDDFSRLMGGASTTPAPAPVGVSSPPSRGVVSSLPTAQRAAPQESLSSLPQAVLAFQTKFNLPASVRPTQYFPLASSCFIYLTKQLVCVESLFAGNEAIQLTQVAKLHKSRPGLLGKGTGGRIELQDGRMIELSGMIKRRDTYHAIVQQAKTLGHSIPIYRDGEGKEESVW